MNLQKLKSSARENLGATFLESIFVNLCLMRNDDRMLENKEVGAISNL